MQTDPIQALRDKLPEGAETLNSDIVLAAAEAGDADMVDFLDSLREALETPEVEEWVLTQTLVAKYTDSHDQDNWVDGDNLRYRRTWYTEDAPDGFSIGENVYKSREHDVKYDWHEVAQQDRRHRNANYRTYHTFPAIDVTMVYNSRKGRNPDTTVMWDDRDETPILAGKRQKARNRKTYSSNAERQKAYRERQRCETCKTDGRDNCPDHRE